MFAFRWITLFCLGYRLSKCKMTILYMLKILGDHGLCSPWLPLWVSGSMPLSCTSAEETFHVRSTHMSITPNASMSCYTQYLFSGQVPTLGYGRPTGHVLNETSNATWYNQPENIRYKRLATKHQQTTKCDNRSSHKKLHCNLLL